MCGIAGGLGEAPPDILAALRHRGPDAEATERVGSFWLAHTRLAVQDLDERSNQPFHRGRIVLVYNGELWNPAELRAELEALGETFSTPGDTEVVAAALDRWGPAALPRLRGMFALAWTDGEALWLSRDRHGECPLHFWAQPFAFASELKSLRVALGGRKVGEWVEPGELVVCRAGKVERSRWNDIRPLKTNPVPGAPEKAVRVLLERGVRDRTISDAPVCTLLSGGIDSSVIAALLKRVFPDIVAYTAVYDPRSRDLRFAREVAEFLDMELREVEIPEPSAEGLSEVVAAIEQPNKAQVEIGWGCLALARAIRLDGFAVTYSGEGSDELWGSYRFVFPRIRAEGFYEVRRRLVFEQHRKNFARANKVFMRHGVECRLPFLDPGLVSVALGLTLEQVRKGRKDSPSGRKIVLQDAVEDLLPRRAVRRAKEGFQDGCGIKGACARAVADPVRFYRSEFRRMFGAAKA